MKIKNIIIISIIALGLMASLGCLGSDKEKIYVSGNFEEVYNSLYSDKLTDLQRDNLWESYENKYVIGTVYVQSVDKDGLTGILTLSKFWPQADIEFKSSEKSKLLLYSEDDQIHFEGRLDHYASALGINTIYLVDAVVIGSNSGAGAQQIPTPIVIPEPEETIDKYIFAYNLIQTDYIYDDLLSESLKNQTSKSKVHNNIYALVSQGLTAIDYTVIEKNISGETANMKIEFNWNVEGFRISDTRNVNLTLENNEWKITDKLLRM